MNCKLSALSMARACTWSSGGASNESDEDYRDDVELQTTLAPEMYTLHMEAATPAADWFSYAMVVYEIFLGHHPHHMPGEEECSTIKDKVRKKQLYI